MFYSGGAKKKNAIREILKFHPEKIEEPESTSESEYDRNSVEDSDRSSRSGDTSDSESESGSDSDGEGESISSKHKSQKNANHDEEENSSELSINPDNNDYIVTLSSNDATGHHYQYSFIDEELDYDIEEFADTHPEIKKYHMVIYKINTRSSLPFLEFLFYYDKSNQTACSLPEYRHKSKHNIRKDTDGIMNNLFIGKYRFKGFFHDSITDQCFIFYEKYFVNEPKNENTALVSLQTSDNWLWICTTEIMYNRKYLTIPIHDDSIDFFIAYPTVGILQATTVSNERTNRFKRTNIEAPTILYYGSDICYSKNTTVYGLKREPIVSRYGPFYYFTTLEQSFYWACYLKSNDKTKRRETSNGGISRYAVFTKKMKTAFIDDDYDVEVVKKYIARKNTFETKTTKFRETRDVNRPNKMFESIYGYDYDWTIDYDTIYNGYYHVGNKDILRPVWGVCDHHNFQLLSYYEVNVEKCPEHYDPSFLDYKIM